MENFNEAAAGQLGLIVPVLSALLFASLVFSACIYRKLGVLQRKYETFTKGDNVNIDTVLTRCLGDIEVLQKNLNNLQESHQSLTTQVQGCIQHVKISRYDAFEAMGGEMSYSILLTDQKKNGLILTSLYGRDSNRCYAKSVQGGKALHALAAEEKSLLEE